MVAKSGQTIITNNPKKRPLSTYFDSIFIMAAYGGSALFVANYLGAEIRWIYQRRAVCGICILGCGIVGTGNTFGGNRNLEERPAGTL